MLDIFSVTKISINKAMKFCTILVLWWGVGVPGGYREAPPSKTFCRSYGYTR